MEVQKKAEELNASVHMPRIGVGLGGGQWSIILILNDCFFLHIRKRGKLLFLRHCRGHYCWLPYSASLCL